MGKVIKLMKMVTPMKEILSMAKDMDMADFYGKMDNNIKANGNKTKKKAVAPGRVSKEIAI